MEGYMIYMLNTLGEMMQILHLPIRSEEWIKEEIQPILRDDWEGEIHIYAATFQRDEEEDYSLGDRIELEEMQLHYHYKDGFISRSII